MRLILVLTLVLLPLVTSSPVSLGEESPLPTLENIETHITNLWGNFKKGYGLVYNTTVEELHRFQIFTKHLKMIVKHNLEHDLGLHSYRLGINKFATLVSSIESKSQSIDILILLDQSRISCPTEWLSTRQTSPFAVLWFPSNAHSGFTIHHVARLRRLAWSRYCHPSERSRPMRFVLGIQHGRFEHLHSISVIECFSSVDRCFGKSPCSIIGQVGQFEWTTTRRLFDQLGQQRMQRRFDG